MAEYGYDNIFKPDLKKGLVEIKDLLLEIDDIIKKRDKQKNVTGEQFKKEAETLKKLNEAQKKLLKAEKDKEAVRKKIAAEQQKREKENQKLINTRLKAEQKAEKFLKQFNKEEVKRTENVKAAAKAIRDQVKEEIALERILKKGAKSRKDQVILIKELNRQRATLGKSTKQEISERKRLTKEIIKQNKALKNSGGLQKSLISSGRNLLATIGIAGGLAQGFTLLKDRVFALDKTQRKLNTLFSLTEKQSDRLTAKINALAVTFDEDYNEIIIAANTVSKEFGISAEESLALVEEGLRKGSNVSGEFFDILKEYPTQFNAAGIDAETFFSIINQQVKQGIYSDKGIDAIKEGGLRLRENTKAVQDALAPLDDLTKAQIENAVESGKSFEAIQLVSKALSDTSLTAEQTQAIIADVFGGPGEDAGLRYLQLLADIDTNLDNVEETTSLLEKSQLDLNESFNEFILSVEVGEGIISTVVSSIVNEFTGLFDTLRQFNEGTFLDKLKILANGFLSLIETALVPLIKILGLVGIEVPKFRFEIEETVDTQEELAEATKASNEELNKQSKSFSKVKKEARDANKELRKQNKLIRNQVVLLALLDKAKEEETEEDEKSELDAQKELDKALLAEEKSFQQQVTAIQSAADDERLKNAQTLENQIKELKVQAVESGVQIISNLVQFAQDERLAQENSRIESEKKLLEDQLDKGLISQEKYNQSIAQLNKEARIAEANAEKKKSLFDIAIATAVAIARSLAKPFLIPGIIAAGALQAAVVLATPIPSFGKGKVNINGEPHSKGGILANIEGGESVINKKATSRSENLLNWINDGVIDDQNAANFLSGDNRMLGKLNEVSRNTNDMVELMGKFAYATKDKKGNTILHTLEGNQIKLTY
jgi:chemotaxis protein histidine kinase CheA